MKKLFVIFLSLIFIFSSLSIGVYADEESIIITDESGNILEAFEVTLNDADVDSRRDIQTALEFVKEYHEENESDEIITVQLPKGEYYIGKSLACYSNTVIDFNNSTIHRLEGCTIALRIGNSGKQVYGDDAFQNVTFKNAVFNSDYIGKAALVKFEHAKNITLDNLTLTDTLDVPHQLAFAACNNVKVNNCKFFNMITSGVETNCEAIQLDVLKQGYYGDGDFYDGTPNKNVYIENCTFKNVEKGLGSHTGITGHYFDNININNNYFENVFGYAIRTVNYKNCTISNNVIKKSNCGILVGNMTSEQQVNYYAPLNDNDKPINDLNIKITNNNIELIDTEYTNMPYGINVFGKIATAKKDKDGNTYSGDFRVSNTIIENNAVSSTVSTQGFFGIKVSGGFGNACSENSNFCIRNNTVTANATKNVASNSYAIRIENCDKVACYKNNINDLKTKVCSLNYGIYANDDSNCYINSNDIINPYTCGIKLSNMKKAVVQNNTVTNTLGYGIYAVDNSSIDNISNNKIATASKCAVFVNDKSFVKNITNNTIKNAKTNAIYLSLNAKATNITSNKISDVKSHAIQLNKSAKATTISKNTIANCKSYAMMFNDNANVTYLNSNTISGSKNHSIYFTTNAKATSITNNYIYNSSFIGIYLNEKSTVKTIKGNIIDINSKTNPAIKINVNAVAKYINNNKINMKQNANSKKLTVNCKDGIFISSDKCNISQINGNFINKCVDNGIYILKAKTSAEINSNSISNCKVGIKYKKAKIKAKNKYKNVKTKTQKI